MDVGSNDDAPVNSLGPGRCGYKSWNFHIFKIDIVIIFI